MPILDGLKTVKHLKQKYKDLNDRLAYNGRDQGGMTPEIVRPLIVHLTQFEESIKQFIIEEEKADVFLHKPIPDAELLALLKLLRLI